MQFPFSALLLVFFKVLPFRNVLNCCTPKPSFLHKNCSGVALGSLANFGCLKQLNFCRKCLSTNSCLTFIFLLLSGSSKNHFTRPLSKCYASIAGVLLFHCQFPALPLPHFCSSIAKWLLFHCHISALQ